MNSFQICVKIPELYNGSMKKSEAVKAVIKSVEAHCKEKGLRLTEPRLLALEIIAGSTKPLGAYDVLEKMGKTLDSPKPMTAYRAIDFLQQHGFIHRIESLNAFVTCHAGHRHEGSQFMVCDDCGHVEEVHLCHLPGPLQKKVDENGFKLARWSTELHGTCQSCQA